MYNRGPLVAICLGTFMLLIDVTIVLVALPDMAGSLGASLPQLQWVADGYALAVAAALLAAGRLADRTGRRQVYLVGLVVFGLASLVCGLAPGMGVLIAARAVQGIGAAAMFTTTLSLLGTLYRGRQFALALGVWAAVAASAAALGPVLGGLLTESLDWRWIFYVNLPLVLLAVGLTFRHIPRDQPSAADQPSAEPSASELPTAVPPTRRDVPGTILFAVAAAGLVHALTQAHGLGWTATATLLPLLGAGLALVLFVLVERHTTHPLLDLSLFRNRAFTAALITIAVGESAVYGVLPYTSLWLQSMRGLGPIGAGLVILPHAATACLVALLCGRLLPKPAPRVGATLGLVLAGVGTGIQGFLTEGSNWPALVVGLAVSGLGMGLIFQVTAGLALGSVKPERAGMASGAYSTFEQLGYAFGVAAFGTLTVSSMRDSLTVRTSDPDHAAQTLSGGGADTLLAQAPPQHRSTLDTHLHAVFATAHNTLTLTAAALLLCTAATVFLLTRPGQTRPEPAA
jgi:EmrB/QacA subfamily drug resistance transporter